MAIEMKTNYILVDENYIGRIGLDKINHPKQKTQFNRIKNIVLCNLFIIYITKDHFIITYMSHHNVHFFGFREIIVCN